MLYYACDRWNVLRSFLAPLIFFYPFAFGFPGDLSAVWFVVAFLFIGDMNYVLHLHIHHPFTRSRVANLALDLCLGSVTGMTASNWRIQHKYGHHRGQDTPYCDARPWEIERYSILGALSFSLRSIFPTFLEPYKEAFRKGVLDNRRRPISYRWAFIEQSLSVGLVVVLALWKPVLVLCYVLPWYALVYFISRYVDYLNHYGCDEGRYSSANNCLHKSFNRWKHNFGYHTAHHLYAGAHWSKLPEIHASIEHLIPERNKKAFSWSFLLMPYHFYLSRRLRT